MGLGEKAEDVKKQEARGEERGAGDSLGWTFGS